MLRLPSILLCGDFLLILNFYFNLYYALHRVCPIFERSDFYCLHSVTLKFVKHTEKTENETEFERLRIAEIYHVQTAASEVSVP